MPVCVHHVAVWGNEQRLTLTGANKIPPPIPSLYVVPSYRPEPRPAYQEPDDAVKSKSASRASSALCPMIRRGRSSLFAELLRDHRGELRDGNGLRRRGGRRARRFRCLRQGAQQLLGHGNIRAARRCRRGRYERQRRHRRHGVAEGRRGRPGDRRPAGANGLRRHLLAGGTWIWAAGDSATTRPTSPGTSGTSDKPWHFGPAVTSESVYARASRFSTGVSTVAPLSRMRV